MMIKNGNRYSIGQFSIRSSFKIDSKRMVMKMKNIRIEEGGFLEGVVFCDKKTKEQRVTISKTHNQ